MHGWYTFGQGSSMGILGWIGPLAMIAFWGIVIVGAIVLIRYLLVKTRESSPGASSRPDAIDILKERYARGELTREEFEAKKLDIQ